MFQALINVIVFFYVVIHVTMNIHAWSSYRTETPPVLHTTLLQSKHFCSGTINFLGLGVSTSFSFETEGSQPVTDVVGQFLPRDE